MTARDLVWGRQGGRVVEWDQAAKTCILCRAPLPAGRFLYCRDACSAKSRAAAADKRNSTPRKGATRQIAQRPAAGSSSLAGPADGRG